ncbi:phosphoribosylanthranilate isomerase [Martiniozyma asiatica (nom. inval.)]|nr:phosphoribosylanthranilate isomerase [Martiniozyma asiatica]
MHVIKCCGLGTEEAASVAIESGANLLGIIVVPGRARTVDPEIALKMSHLCREARIAQNRKFVDSKDLLKYVNSLSLNGAEWFEKVSQVIIENGPYLVGVFRNQPLDEVKDKAEGLKLDFVQLHGSENFDDYIGALEIPVIARYILNKSNIKDALVSKKHILPLLDSEAGGEGKLISWDDASIFGKEMTGRYLLAGGLTPDNVQSALAVEGCLGVDVSGGIETNGKKDEDKIKKFVENCL